MDRQNRRVFWIDDQKGKEINDNRLTETRHVTLTPMEYQVFVQMALLHQEKNELRVMPMRGLRRLTR